MRRCTILVSLFFSIIANNAFTQEAPALGYVPDMDSPAILQRVERFLDEYIDPKHSAEYRQAVGKIFLMQLNFVDATGSPERTTINNVQTINGETTLSLSRRGKQTTFSIDDDNRNCEKAIILRNKSIIALNWFVKSEDYEGASWGTAFGATDSLLETIAKITTLEKLELGGGIMTDNGLKKLASLTQLKTLVFREGYHSIPGPPAVPTLTYSTFDALHGLVNLETLVLPSGDLFQPNADCTPLFRALPHYPRLKSLGAVKGELSPQNMQRLSQCRELEELTLKGTMPVPCLEELATLPNLKNLSLDISGCNQSFTVAHFPALEGLSFQWSIDTSDQKKAGDIPIITFTSLLKLKQFWFNSTPCDFHVVVSNNPNLQTLRIDAVRVHVSDSPPPIPKTFFTLENLPALTGVGIGFPGAECNITNTPQLVVLHLPTNTLLSLDAFPRPGSSPDFYGSGMSFGSLTEESVLPNTPGTFTGLTWLKEGSPAVLLHLLRFSPKVKDLQLGESVITPEIFEAIVQMTELEKLTLSRCTLPDGIDFSQLKTVKCIAMSDMNLPAVLGHFPAVNELRLDKCTSPAEFSLVNMPALTGFMIDSHTGCKTLLVKDMPHLAYAHVPMGLPSPPAKSGQSDCESVVFLGCPMLRDGMFPHDVKHLDIRSTQFTREHRLVRHYLDIRRPVPVILLD